VFTRHARGLVHPADEQILSFFFKKKKKRENNRNLLMLSAAAPNPESQTLSPFHLCKRRAATIAAKLLSSRVPSMHACAGAKQHGFFLSILLSPSTPKARCQVTPIFPTLFGCWVHHPHTNPKKRLDYSMWALPC
jgi:hypothetical protein